MTRPLHVLLVDDDEVARHRVRVLLRNTEHPVVLTEADDIGTGIATLRARLFDCAIIDHRLPGGDAFTLLSMAAESEWGATPMVVLTKAADQELGIRFVKAGAQDFLSKDNLEAESLLRAIRSAIERKRTEAESRAQFGHLYEMEKLEAVASLARGIAHQFNNLLMVMIGLGELVRDELQSNSPVRSDLEEILDAGHRASTLTEQLLAFSRTDMSQPQILDLNTVVGSTRNLVSEMVGRNIRISHDLADGLRPVKIDPGHLERIIINLCLNAGEAMTDGGHVSLSTRDMVVPDAPRRKDKLIKPGGYVEFVIEDTGHGMPKEIVSRCFEPFFTTKGPGCGLGLSMVYGLVRQAEGEISITSKESEGTQVRVLLPAYQELSRPAFRPVAKGIRSHTRTVLLAEDEPSVRKLTVRLLEKSGFTVLVADDGPAAIAMADKRGLDNIDLLLTDSVMPQMTGAELAQRLLDRRPDLPVLIMSGYTETPTVANMARNANMAFLRKPFSSERLAQAIESLYATPGSDMALDDEFPF